MKLIKKETTYETSERVLLVILDGVGYSENDSKHGNAVKGANLPVLNDLWNNHPTIQIQAHGKAVGMPSDDDMGNSEVGHNALGCGRVYDQGAKLVSKSIETGDMYKGEVWKEAIANCKSNRSTLHFLGLFSDGNVHSHIDHLKAMIEQAKKEGVQKVRIHILLDGRDVPETSALEYVNPFEDYMKSLQSDNFDICIASGGGRMTVTMDRYEADWGMVERGWNIHVKGEGRSFKSAREAIETYRKEDAKAIDQYLPGFVIANENGPVGKILDGDSVVFYNFRGDRAIEISRAFTEKGFNKFDVGKRPNVFYAGMMQYDGDLKLPEKFLVTPPSIEKTLGEYMAKSEITQYAISETQKYGHVTYFWNGNRSGYFDKNFETYQEIPSDVIPFDQLPKMKAVEITDALLKAMESQKYQFLRANYANGDMVGHTGDFNATVMGLECVDECVGKLKEAAIQTDTVLLVTADHGNADEMYQLDKKKNVKVENGKPVAKTSHTLNKVNLVLFDPKSRWELSDLKGTAGLANIAATVLDIMGYEAPEGYYPSLLKSK
ncbi:MAG: 2,3-bisphosphoglycerate-independent phosphoglycerate mutase [Leptospiraceae bacterium]|nr:2,3-bisphosphoglycerate-independent phosphoglycerate mutase [Leptospiraceae bacterium]MCP5493445.1 2,3-bisphosphoglycerate-independent phosphoglycerate mutase [Leptospiraceae bacterium]